MQLVFQTIFMVWLFVALGLWWAIWRQGVKRATSAQELERTLLEVAQRSAEATEHTATATQQVVEKLLEKNIP